ncbi:MAG TPA: phosphatase PAP2 family protein [Pedococcus sp.]|jgi:undecaprenyl-diphosphatase|nr:phosphatase PAP2 family protein [Pedococcus sp.]
MFAAARDRLRGSLASQRQFGARVTLAAVAVGVLAVPFGLLLLSVESKWGPLRDLDGSARDGLHRYALAHHGFATLMEAVSNSGSGLAWQIVTVVLAAVLLFRRRVRVAVFVIVANAGSSLLNTFVKTATNRSRPSVDHPLLTEPGKSFPSGHAQAAIVGYMVLLLVLLPYLHRGWRRAAFTVAVVMVAAIGFSRVALSVHYVSDVLAAYLLGMAWVAALASTFHVWRRTTVQVGQAGAPTGDQQPFAEPAAKLGGPVP